MSETEKSADDSKVESMYLALPKDANTIGLIFGGRILQLMDMVATLAARRHSTIKVVTKAVDEVRFVKPIEVGQVMIFAASVNRVFVSSMEVGVKVFSEDTQTSERQHAASAYFTFVGLDENDKPKKLPGLTPTTKTEKRRWEEAQVRRLNRQRR